VSALHSIRPMRAPVAAARSVDSDQPGYAGRALSSNHHHTTTMHKVIPLKDVSVALMCAVVRLKTRSDDGGRHGRTAAFTQAPFWEPTCRDRVRGSTPRPAVRQHFSVMHSGDMGCLLQRSRLHHGLLEVRQTWGAGYRALQGEFNASTVMR
jgi:hypothetical protein